MIQKNYDKFFKSLTINKIIKMDINLQKYLKSNYSILFNLIQLLFKALTVYRLTFKYIPKS